VAAKSFGKIRWQERIKSPSSKSNPQPNSHFQIISYLSILWITYVSNSLILFFFDSFNWCYISSVEVVLLSLQVPTSLRILYLPVFLFAFWWGDDDDSTTEHTQHTHTTVIHMSIQWYVLDTLSLCMLLHLLWWWCTHNNLRLWWNVMRFILFIPIEIIRFKLGWSLIRPMTVQRWLTHSVQSKHKWLCALRQSIIPRSVLSLRRLRRCLKTVS